MIRTARNSILIISHDVVGRQMAGPGIRYYHLARVMGQELSTVLAVPSEKPPDVPSNGFRIVQYDRIDWGSIVEFVEASQIVIFPSDIANDFPQIADSDAYLVIDGYDPLLVEWLALNGNIEPGKEMPWWKNRMCDLVQQYLIGDFYICASERQRDWWLGSLEAHGRINPYTFGEDASLRKLIDVVPYGLPESAPQRSKQVIKGVWPGIEPDDKVILWGGGLWPWLDPLTAIEAVAKIWQKRRDVRLVFPGTKHPNPQLKGIPTHNEAAHHLARKKGLLNQAVFFGDWIPYADWPNVLIESDVALSLHYDTLEARLAFRSRILDYIWAGLPTIAARGDATSDLIADYELGVVVDYEDTEGVAEAIKRLLELPGESFDAQFDRIRQELTWEHVVEPLMDFCRDPRKAPDRMALAGKLGNPFYVGREQQLVEACEHWRELVHGYEQGRFIRFMRWLAQMHRKISGGIE